MKKILEESGYDQDFSKSFILAFVSFKFFLIYFIHFLSQKEEKKNNKKKIQIKGYNKSNNNKEKEKKENKNDSNNSKKPSQKNNNSNNKKEKNIQLDNNNKDNLNISITPIKASINITQEPLDETRNIQNFIKKAKKNVIFQNTNSQEILLENDIKTSELMIKNNDNDDNSDNKDSNVENNSETNVNDGNDTKENEYKKKKELYDANKYLDILSSTIKGESVNDDDDNENEEELETIYNDDYGNLDEIILK